MKKIIICFSVLTASYGQATDLYQLSNQDTFTISSSIEGFEEFYTEVVDWFTNFGVRDSYKDKKENDKFINTHQYRQMAFGGPIMIFDDNSIGRDVHSEDTNSSPTVLRNLASNVLRYNPVNLILKHNSVSTALRFLTSKEDSNYESGNNKFAGIKEYLSQCVVVFGANTNFFKNKLVCLGAPKFVDNRPLLMVMHWCAVQEDIQTLRKIMDFSNSLLVNPKIYPKSEAYNESEFSEYDERIFDLMNAHIESADFDSLKSLASYLILKQI